MMQEIKLEIFKPTRSSLMIATVECAHSDDLKVIGICKDRNGDKLIVANCPVYEATIEVVNDKKIARAKFEIHKPSFPTNYVAYIKIAASLDKIYGEIMTVAGAE